MNILLVHNTYQQPGGEDQVFQQESDLLQAHGHKVIQFREHNDQVANKNKLALIRDTVWNNEAYRRIESVIVSENIDILHAHNTFPLLSPSIYHAATAHAVPVIQTLHNYRLICPAATLFRDGHICEECVGRLPLPGVIHRCYRGSLATSAVSGAMLTVNRFLGSYNQHVTRYIALSHYMREKFLAAGFPPEKIAIKPNFLGKDPGLGTGDGQFCLFAGRLTEEKGIQTLLNAWQQQNPPELPLTIVGQGPLQPLVEQACSNSPNIRFSPWLEKDQLLSLMKKATLLIVPSLWYEPFAVIILEAFATGLPVIASKLGTLTSLIQNGQTGMLFEAGNSVDLASKVKTTSNDSCSLRTIRAQARQEFLRKFTGQANYRDLIGIYEGARASLQEKAA